jgi:hypothetical protein
VLALKGRPLADEHEEEKIKNKMIRIMTGEDTSEYAKERMRKGAFASHETRTMMS